MTKVALVTGSSSGIGYETSLLLARNQFATYASMRNLKKGDELLKIATNERIPLKVIQLDVDDDKSVSNAVNTIVKENGRIDILVNNAGFDLFGSLEELTIDEIKGQFETNFFGLIRATKAVIPTMRKQGSGTIVNISSLGGRIGLVPFLTAYHASKFAVEGFTESLRQELAQFNVDVILIEPGNIRSNFIDNSKNAKNYNPENSPYASTIQNVFEGFQSILADSSRPRDVAGIILKVVNTSSPDVRYPVGKDAESVLKARAELSDKELEKWVRESYMDKKGFIRE
ncbi:MAG TPA: SDR family oxidoreductase [Nitrososphaeraceae archaeon]|nr:SDR family oxidoreductase [Nitrososphaeraceae archaeon]